ncbi:hypothetical protein [Brevundimonas sp.]|uniref:hypothetical protein n=1 Tax=Brevundimonas sp. TaxID=1871086 RepID=UPI002D555964|nr:hypothetical protein [Brevundimonas sp.]HYC99288.1 hypothetical protein [Brevundimonas sp.]
MEIKVPAEAAMAIRLGVQVVVATIMASVISLCALGLALLVKFMQAHDAPEWMVLGTLALEIFRWAADVVCFILFVANEVISFCVGLWRERSWR